MLDSENGPSGGHVPTKNSPTTCVQDPTAIPWPEATREAWRAVVDRDLHGAPFEKRLVSRTYEGLTIQPLYTAEDWDHSGDPAGMPGLSPMLRGGTPLGAVRSGWDIRVERAEPEPESLNTAILDDLVHGATSIDIRLNGAVALGMDHVTPTGAMLLSSEDLDCALKDVHLGMIGVGFTAGAAFAETAGLAHAVWTSQKIDPASARLAFNADPLAEFARSGSLPVPIDEMLDRLGTLAVWTDKAYPRATAVRVSSSPYHDANATAAQDLAFSMATAVTYLRAMERSGLEPARAARQVVFQFSLSCNFFLAIAKLRAARRMWSGILEHTGIAACPMRIEARAARRSLTRRDPWVNMLRNTAACFAGAVGGADTILSVPFDEPLGGPDPLARRIARNTQTILSEEAHLHRVMDPAGGSWYQDRLADDLANAAWKIFQEVERAGGMAPALSDGLIHDRIAASYAARLKSIAKRKDAVTGVSEFASVAEESLPREAPDPGAIARSAADRLAQRHTERGLKELIEKLRRQPWSDRRLESMAQAAAAGARSTDLAEAINTIGQAPTIEPIAPHAYAEPFEAIRDRSDSILAESGARPSVCVVAVGPAAEHTARANFTAGFFEAGGFEVYTPPAAADVQLAAGEFAASGAEIAAICAADPRYPDLVPELAPLLRAAGAQAVVLAGRPGTSESAWREAGVDRFVFMGCDAVKTLTELMNEEGAHP